NWHDAVGPIDQRPNFSFGVDEFIAYCRAVGAEPLMTVSAYVGTPQDSADLVEYCNAPADAQHPWAQKRAQWGHPQPYGIRYFEMGNESDHGNHNVIPHKQYTAEEYAQWFNACEKLMRKVDPSIQMGPLMGTGTGPSDPWNATVLTMTKGRADFIIVHTYAVGCGDAAERIPADTLMQACMAACEQVESRLGDYRRLIKKCTGKNLPLAVTEYNASFVQDKPEPYRYSYGAALHSADYVRVLLKPESNVLMANYWQLANGYWGMIQGFGPYKKMPAYYLYRLWAQHFGPKLVAVNVNSPQVSFAGSCRVAPASGKSYFPGKALKEDLLDVKRDVKPVSGSGFTCEVRPDGTLVATLKDLETEQYPEFAVIKAPKIGMGYKISFEARSTGNVKNATMGLGLGDSRGWSATSSAIGVEGIESATQWKKFEKTFNTLSDCPGALLLWRLRASKGSPVTGTLEVRNLRVTPYVSEQFPAYHVITSSASMSADGKTLYLIIFNKHMTDNIPVQLSLKHLTGITSVRRWMVTGPNLASLNLAKEEVREVESGVEMPLPQAGMLNYTAPARSMTAIEVRLQ
ncbi:MAG TPA: alpha-L-arabinofuranosidase C-terminal domain-containing protein, partial [Armatimonadota bacterium]|nr:alpha-L-arabinofuranosidase C-terminal domain-containing protein [Armatimonadota bacterium]